MRFRHLVQGSLLTAASVCLSIAAQAGDGFTVRDTNADGVLSGREAKGLKGLDSDKDGEISNSEFHKSVASWRQKLEAAEAANFKTMDGNEDGRLSGSEVKGYDFCDANNDGRITRKEFDDGQTQRRLQLAALPTDQIQQASDDYFRTLDANEDGRLTGIEIVGMDRYDANSDLRTSKDEWSFGVLMDALSASDTLSPATVPDSTPSSEPSNAGNGVQLLADAVNSQNAQVLFASLRPELIEMVDEIILQYSVAFVHKHHGVIQAIPESAIQKKPSDNPDAVEYSASVDCERGKLRLITTVFEGKLLGLKIDSPAIVDMDNGLYVDLSNSLGPEDGLAKQFAEFYSPKCLQLINSVLTSSDDEALALVHPLVREQIGREAFDAVFKLIREQCGEQTKVELESFLIEEDHDGSHMFKIGHRVTGGRAPQMLTVGFQIIGMKAAIVSVAISPVNSENANADAKPTTLQQLVDEAWKKLDEEAKSDSAAVAPPSEDAAAPPSSSVKPPLPAPPRLD